MENEVELLFETALQLAGLSHRAVAEIMGKSDNAVRSRWKKNTEDARRRRANAEARIEQIVDERVRRLVLEESGLHEYALTKFREWCEEHPL